MKKHTKLNWQLPFVAFAVITLLLVGQTEIAAQNQRIFKPGDTVTDGGYVYKILRCKGEGEWDECETQAYLDGKPTGAGGPQWWTIRNLRAIEERYLETQKRKNNSDGRTENSNNNTARQNPADTTPQPTVSPTSPKTKPPMTSGKIAGADGKWKVGDKLEVESRAFWYPAEIIAVNGNKYKIHYEGYPASDDEWVEDYRMRPVGGYQITAECEYDLPGEVSPSAKPSEQLFKKKIWQRYFIASQAGGNPSVSSPLTTGIVFLTFQMDASFKNTVGVRPGGGASRINNGAPVNATIYPVKTKYVICKKFKDGVSRSLHDEEMNCFKNKEGEWTCDGAGVPKITQID